MPGKMNRENIRSLFHLSLSFLLVNMGWGMAWPYLPNYMRLLGGSMLFVALLSVLFNLTSFFGQYFWGRKSDHVKRRKPFITLGILSSLLFFMLMGIIQSSIALLSLRTFQGFFTSSQTPAASALVSELSENVGQGFGIFNLFSNVGFMGGNFIGGFVTSHYPVNYLFIFSSIPFILSFIPLHFVMEKKKEPVDFRMIFRYEGSGRAIFKLGNLRKFILKNKNLLIFTLSAFITMIASGMVYSYLSILIGLRFGKNFVGFYFGVDSLVSSLLIYPFGKLSDTVGSKIVVIFGLITYAITFVLYYYAISFILLFSAAIISGTKWAAYFNSINSYVSRMSHREERATALGLLNSGIAMGWVIGPLLGAFLIEFVSLAFMILLATLPVIVSISIVMFVKNDRLYKDGSPVI